jgi:C_GCAxxG_C_C family probable redox protein
LAEGDLSVAEQAVEEFKNGLFCSEAILQVCNKNMNLGLSDSAIKMATGFGAGLGGAKCCCGSLTGAVLVLSAIKGRESVNESVDEVFKLTNELHDRFKERFRATCCRVLTKTVEWGAPEHHQLCEKYVRGAVEILYDLLTENEFIKEEALNEK